MILEKLGLRKRILLVAFLVAGMVFCFCYFVFFPQARTYREVKKELTSQKLELARAQAVATSFRSESLRLKKVKKEMERISKFFETEMRDGSVVILLGLRATAKNVEITSMEPGLVKENKHTLELPLKLTVSGYYPNVLDFCNDVENLTNLAEITRLKAESFSSGGTSPGMVKTSWDVVVYSAKTPKGRLYLDEMARWATGRYNVFRPAGGTAPIPELVGHLKVPAGDVENEGNDYVLLK